MMGYNRNELPDEYGTHGPDEPPPPRRPFEETLSWLDDIVPEAWKMEIASSLKIRVHDAVDELRSVLETIQEVAE